MPGTKLPHHCLRENGAISQYFLVLDHRRWADSLADSMGAPEPHPPPRRMARMDRIRMLNGAAFLRRFANGRSSCRIDADRRMFEQPPPCGLPVSLISTAKRRYFPRLDGPAVQGESSVICFHIIHNSRF
jgi:hypothetical protein